MDVSFRVSRPSEASTDICPTSGGESKLGRVRDFTVTGSQLRQQCKLPGEKAWRYQDQKPSANLITLRPNQIDSTLRSALRVHSTLTAQRSTRALREHRCSLSSDGSMSSRLSCKYTVVPLAYASPSKKPACNHANRVTVCYI